MHIGKMCSPDSLSVEDFATKTASELHLLMHFLLVFAQEVRAREDLVASLARKPLLLVHKLNVQLERCAILIHLIALLAREMTFFLVIVIRAAVVVVIVVGFGRCWVGGSSAAGNRSG